MWHPWKKGPSGFSSQSTAEEVTHGVDATGLTAIVTGASSGIGSEIARVLVLRGAHVVMAVRNVESGRKVKEDIICKIPDAKIDVLELDLSSMESVRRFASEYNSLGLPLNILVNNAGVMASPFALSQDGIEMQFATNHIGHFLLTNLLLENMKRTAHESQREGRIVNVSSAGHKLVYREGIHFDKINDQSSYWSFYAYGQSKLANILHANELARRLKEEGVNITANSVHPGAIMTNLIRHQKLMGFGIRLISRLPFIKDVQQGAAPPSYLALNPQVQGVTGQYFSDCDVTNPSALAKDSELAKKLWEFSLNLTERK